MKNRERSGKEPSLPKEKGGCLCPYCDEQIMLALAPFCQSCGMLLNYCVHCHTSVAPNLERCPDCGRPTEKKEVK